MIIVSREKALDIIETLQKTGRFFSIYATKKDDSLRIFNCHKYPNSYEFKGDPVMTDAKTYDDGYLTVFDNKKRNDNGFRKVDRDKIVAVGFNKRHYVVRGKLDTFVEFFKEGVKCE